MTITNKELVHLAELAYLNIHADNNDQLHSEINAIMDFVEQLRQVNTTGLAPLFHPFDLHQRVRPDEVSEQDCNEQLAAIAPCFEDELYLVPKMLDGGS